MTADIKRVQLDDSRYTVKQSLVRNKYRVYDSSGELVLKTKQKLFKIKEEFSFQNAEGETAFKIKADNVFDIAGEYSLVDEETGETVAVLEKKFTFFKHLWKVKRPENGELIAEIESSSTIMEALRSISDIFDLVPHSYVIKGRSGDRIGSINARFRIRDIYDVEIDEVENVPREAIVATAVAIDALEAN